MQNQEVYDSVLAKFEKLFGASSQLFFNQEVLRDMWDRFIGGESLLWNRMYAIYAFLLWYDLNFAAA